MMRREMGTKDIAELPMKRLRQMAGTLNIKGYALLPKAQLLVELQREMS